MKIPMFPDKLWIFHGYVHSLEGMVIFVTLSTLKIGNSAQTPSGQDLLHVGHSGCRIGHLEEVADWWANRVNISDPLSVVCAMLGNVTYQVRISKSLKLLARGFKCL